MYNAVIYNSHCCTAGDDFTLLDNLVIFVQGSPPNTTECIRIEIVDDQEGEGTEFFTLLVQGQQTAVDPDRSTIRITIQDDDGTCHSLHVYIISM